MTEREYRQDDETHGYCPAPDCGEPLSGLTVAGRGYCDRHGWTFADWTPRSDHDRFVDTFDEILRTHTGRGLDDPPFPDTASGTGDDERNDAR
jgi:hypothetical protein